jgi:C_GCAxxG_C_C family probable redox protein
MSNRQVITDFIKAFSCSYSMTRNLGLALGLPEDPLLLQAVLGFGSGVSTMGDTCGAANGGCVVLGCRFTDLPDTAFYPLCADFFRRLEQRRGTPDCGRVHGGKHLANNLRRAILTGKPLQCMGILRQTAAILKALEKEVSAGNLSGGHDAANIAEMVRHFSENNFHCGHSTIQSLGGSEDKKVEMMRAPSRGFCGGIGFNGTLCGAISGAVLWLGLAEGVDLRSSGYLNGMRTVWGGLTVSDAVFTDENRFPAARVFQRCREVYQVVEKRFGGAHCSDILGLRLNTTDGVHRYITENKLERCREVVETIVEVVTAKK